MCFVFIWEQTATCATYSINWSVFITEMKSVYSAVRTGSLNKAVCASPLGADDNTLSSKHVAFSPPYPQPPLQFAAPKPLSNKAKQRYINFIVRRNLYFRSHSALCCKQRRGLLTNYLRMEVDKIIKRRISYNFCFVLLKLDHGTHTEM